MKCRLISTSDTDTICWVPKDKFEKHFDQYDYLEYRRVLDCKPVLLNEWFVELQGEKYFVVPAVTLIRSETQFISGRHRTSVLYDQVDCIPMAFDLKARILAEEVGLNELLPIEVFELPDLPILSEKEVLASP